MDIWSVFPFRIKSSTLFAVILFVLLVIGISSPVFSADTNGEPVSTPIDSKSIIQRLTLSPAERAWLANTPTIRVRVGAAPPLHSFEKGGARGISVDYMRLFCEGFELRCTFFTMPWKGAIENIGAGKGGDLILTIKHTAGRESLISFTSDYLQMPWVIFARKDSPFIGGMADLEGKTLSIEHGFAIRELIEREYPDIKLLEVETSKDAVKALATGLVDAYVGNLTIGSYLINRWGFNNVKVAAPTPFGSHDQAMGVRKDWPELVSLMDRFLAGMIPQEHSKIKNRWLSVQYEHGIDWPFVWKFAGVISSTAILIIIVIVLWNRRLQREIILRKRAEQELRIAHDELEVRVEERTKELKNEVAERKQAEKKAEAANRAKSAFLSSMSHELMTPLNAIIGFGELLKTDPKKQFSKDQAECVHYILDSSHKLHDLIKKVLSFSEITDGAAHIVPSDVVVKEMAEECVAVARTDADKHEIELILDVPDDDLPTISIDPMRGKEILLIFLSNAILYNHAGGEVRISVSPEKDGWLRISVSDTGQGIPKEKHEEVFLTFHRLGMENTEIGGTGVGLAIAKELSEFMGGRVGFESEEGKGSTFWVEFSAVHQE